MFKQTVLLIFCGLWAAQVSGQALCPLPSQQQVSFAQVTALVANSPHQVLSYGSHELQYGELYLPAAAEVSASDSNASQDEVSAAPPAPLVIFVHGGCWLNAYAIDHSRAVSTALAAAGYAVWSLEYRRTGDPGGGWPGSYQDVVAGINFADELANPIIDKTKVALVGHSAGGHLVLLAAGDAKLRTKPDVAIGLAPIVDIGNYAAGNNSCQLAAAQFMGGIAAQKPADYRTASPAQQGFLVKALSIHGDQDQIVPLSQSTENLPTAVVAGAGHFDLIHPHTSAYQQLLKTLAQHL